VSVIQSTHLGSTIKIPTAKPLNPALGLKSNNANYLKSSKNQEQDKKQ